MPNIRTLIVDDEQAARKRLRLLLEGESDVEVVGEYSDGVEAVSAIRELRPDLIFLDIQIPELDGFEVLERISDVAVPMIVFVTAYDGYALRAFEVHALDYLLKPFNRARFEKALGRARTNLQSGLPQAELMELLHDLRVRRNHSKRLIVKSSGQIFFQPVTEIDWMETAGNYVCLHVGKKSHLVRETMGSLQTRLDPQQFLRIQRRVIVNLESVARLHPMFRGEFAFILKDGTRLTSSKTYRDRISVLLESGSRKSVRR